MNKGSICIGAGGALLVVALVGAIVLSSMVPIPIALAGDVVYGTTRVVEIEIVVNGVAIILTTIHCEGEPFNCVVVYG